MNCWTKLSIEYANQCSYLDDLFQVYPTIPEGLREIDSKIWSNVEYHFKRKDNLALITELLNLDLFPIKDSYMAYLKRDKSALERNPRTINRICGRLYEMGLNKIFERGHQNAQFNDAISTIETPNIKAIKVAILDGVLYIEGNNKMRKLLDTTYRNYNIMSALVLREFLYQI
ncbi:hypothetical protein [Helicobacter pylori]|uniref:hypothetical protein n=1 Tax=Helicobacter pylori TaxID=210 RepID=UPI00165B74CF|nr:hypothetical protein [Helicobacter pylori]MBH0249366.1 hypothetical protein [Helicobacter pylori]